MRHFVGSDPIGALFTQAFADLRSGPLCRVRGPSAAVSNAGPSAAPQAGAKGRRSPRETLEARDGGEGLQYASQLLKGRTIKQTVCRRASSNRAIIIFDILRC